MATTTTSTTSTASTATTSAQTATRALITELGAGSGIDMNALAANLATAQFASRTDQLTTKSDKLDSQISTASNLKSMLLNLSTSLGTRVRQGDLSPQPQIANAAVAQASLSGTSQPKGTYSLEVTARAASQTLASPAYAASTDAVGAGTLTLRFGAVAGGAFSEDTVHTAVTIDIAAGASLADVASAINGKSAGVTAYVAQTVDGAQLVLKGAEGAKSGFVLEATETAGQEGLANLAWSPGTAAGTTPRLLTTSADAAFKVDGLAMTSPSNTVTDAIPGVTLKLSGTNPGLPTNVTFSNPADTITTAMTDLTSALNEFVGALNQATNPLTGDLARDSGARALSRTFSSLAGRILMPGAAEGAPNSLSDLGLVTQRDGTFTLDATRLAATLKANPEAVAAMFTTGINGVYGTIDSIQRSTAVISDPGTLAGSIKRYTDQKSDVTDDQAKLADQQETVRANLAARFAVTDNQISSMKSTLSFLQNQIAAWNAKD